MVDSTSPIFRLASLPGRGFGLLAARPIKNGELLISETPIFSAHTSEAEVEAAVKALDDEGRGLFFGLSDSFAPDAPTAFGIYNTNAIGLGAYGPSGGILPTCARINHSCVPNAHQSWCEELGHEFVYAMTDIPEGEEIVCAYISHWEAREKRQATLSRLFNFTCQCPACLGPPNPESDARREKLSELEEIVGENKVAHPPLALRSAMEQIRLLDEEGLYDTILRGLVQHQAFQACVRASDYGRARRHIGQAYAFRLMSEGPSSEGTKDNLQLYQDCPTQPIQGQVNRVDLPHICDACGREGSQAGLEAEENNDHPADTEGTNELVSAKIQADAPMAWKHCEGCDCAVYCSLECLESHATRHRTVCDLIGEVRVDQADWVDYEDADMEDFEELAGIRSKQDECVIM